LARKVPITRGWTTRTFNQSRSSDHWRALLRGAARHGNIGASVGPLSDNLIAIDVDTDSELEAFLTANSWATQTARSRAKKGAQFWSRIKGFYPACWRGSGSKAPGGDEPLIEWRAGGGHQSVIYGQHPDKAPEGTVIRYRRVVNKPAITIRFTDIVWPDHWRMPFTKEPPFVVEPIVTPSVVIPGATMTNGPSNPVAVAWPPVPLTRQDETYVLRYINRLPDAIDGHGGSQPTIRVASILVWDFNFDDITARRLFEPYNQRCRPPWNEAEIAHKFESARKNPHPKPAGHLWLERRWKRRR
jgi:hypothetical protein